jgi:transposase
MARKSYTPEFKREAVRLASKPGVSRRQAAKQLGIHPNVLMNWQRNFEKGSWNEKPDAELKSEQQKELERLRRENASLKMDLEILKKAAAYFAKESK